MSMGLKANADGSGAIQIGGSDAITITSGLDTTFAGTVTSPTGALYPLVSGTAVASTSGTSVTFTDIPSTAKRVTVMLRGVSTSGVSPIQIQIGSGSIVATGYVGSASGGGSGVSSQSSSTGFLATIAITAANAHTGNITLTNISGNTWVESGMLGASATPAFYASGGTLALGGVLDQIRVTTVNGTDTLDSGSINILWE